MNSTRGFLSLSLIICLIALSLPVQVMAGECTHFIEVKDYTNTIRPNSMLARSIAGYIMFRENNSYIPYHNATITDVYMNVQANGSIHIDVYRTYLSDDRRYIAYELMTEMDFIAQPIVGLNRSIAMPYLNGNVLFGDEAYLWTPSIVVLITNLENYTINVVVISTAYWDVYFVEDDVVSTTDETETTEPPVNETVLPTTTIVPTTTDGDNAVSIWTIIGGVVVVVEGIMIAVLRRLIIRKRRTMSAT